MATYQLMCWQEIPTAVEAREEGGVHKVQLSLRFQELVDLMAMKQGLSGSDAYMDHSRPTSTGFGWRRSRQAGNASGSPARSP